jgi:hypothetical protein
MYMKLLCEMAASASVSNYKMRLIPNYEVICDMYNIDRLDSNNNDHEDDEDDDDDL